MDAPGTRERDDAVAGPRQPRHDAVPPPPRPERPVGERSRTGLAARTGSATRTRTVDAHEDRWAWRRRIKADPTMRRVYRGVVGFVGVALMVLAASIGWLPGPAGIPLFLLGLAILASEFEWAHRLLQRAKVEARKLEERARRQPRWVKWLGGLATLGGIVLVTWGYLALLGRPRLAPGRRRPTRCCGCPRSTPRAEPASRTGRTRCGPPGPIRYGCARPDRFGRGRLAQW